MVQKYDFDRVIDRHNTGSLKYDALTERFGRPDLTPLWVADMDFECIPEVSEAICKRMAHGIYGYQTPPESYWQSIISWIGKKHGVSVTRDMLTFSPGVVKSLAAAVNFFTKRGEEVIIQQPVYHPFRFVVKGAGRRVSNNALVLTERGYEPDLKDLELRMAAGAKLMLLCSPHNPGGIIWSKDILAEIARLAKKYGVTVVSDEIHCDLTLWGNKHTPFTEISPEAAEVGIVLGAPSKTFNIPGFMSSWIAIKNPELRKPFYRWLESTELNDPNFLAVIAAETVYTHGEEWLNQALKYIEGNIIATEQYFATHLPQVKVMRPQASFLVWLDMTNLGLTPDEVADTLVNKAKVALNDGRIFGSGGDGFFRLNVAAPRSVIDNSLQAIVSALKEAAKANPSS